jgi:hypothetical protein
MLLTWDPAVMYLVRRLYNNSLSGEIPRSLTALPLDVLDISNNRLSGDIPVNGSFSQFTSMRFSFLFLVSFVMEWSE